MKGGSTMFNVGDFVVHNGHGLCSILEITHNDSLNTDFYKLQTNHNKMTIMMPVDKAPLFLRPMLTKKTILDALEISVSYSDDYVKDNKERKVVFHDLLTSNDITDTIKLLKMLYHLSSDKKLEKKSLGSFDTQFLQQAERKLFNEVEISCGLSRTEVQSLIFSYLKSQYAF